jgi:hypothetical protein
VESDGARVIVLPTGLLATAKSGFEQAPRMPLTATLGTHMIDNGRKGKIHARRVSHGVQSTDDVVPVHTCSIV